MTLREVLTWLFSSRGERPKTPSAPSAPPERKPTTQTEEAWVREHLELVPINRVITIHGIPVSLKYELEKQGITNGWQLKERVGRLRVAEVYAPKLEAWITELERELHQRYQEQFVFVTS